MVLNGLVGATQTSEPALRLDAHTYGRALDCVHCGLCLPACPTYAQNGLEADSPRGRIYLMKGMADGKIQPTPAVLNHLDLCLDCRACETACPSGVQYGKLIEAARAQVRRHSQRSLARRATELLGQAHRAVGLIITELVVLRGADQGVAFCTERADCSRDTFGDLLKNRFHCRRDSLVGDVEGRCRGNQADSLRRHSTRGASPQSDSRS